MDVYEAALLRCARTVGKPEEVQKAAPRTLSFVGDEVWSILQDGTVHVRHGDEIWE